MAKPDKAEQKKILIVDDEIGFRIPLHQLITGMIPEGKFNVLALEGYIPALEIVMDSNPPGNSVELIVGDLTTELPTLLDFIDVLNQIPIALPIIAMCGYELELDKDRFVANGPRIIATYNKAKPIDGLFSTIASHLKLPLPNK